MTELFNGKEFVDRSIEKVNQGLKHKNNVQGGHDFVVPVLVPSSVSCNPNLLALARV